MIQPGFFDLSNRYMKLDDLGDPLPKIEAVVDWKRFRPTLERVREKPRMSNALLFFFAPTRSATSNFFLETSMPTISRSIDLFSITGYRKGDVAANPGQPCTCKLFRRGGLRYRPALDMASGRGFLNLQTRLQSLRGTTDSPLPRHLHSILPRYKGHSMLCPTGHTFPRGRG